MSTHSCERCGREFKQKSGRTKHLNRKNPCLANSKVNEKIETGTAVSAEECKNEIVYTNTLVENKNVSSVATTTKKTKNTKKTTTIKPILKWVGGKTQILERLMVEFPTVINNYREIFLGGGSVLLTLLTYVKKGIIKIHGNVYAYDLNEPLVFVYKNIQAHHNELFSEITKLIKEFNSCGNGEINRKPNNIEEAKLAKENYYYWIRSQYNKLTLSDKKTILGSAIFIFLNKTCFRGVFRVGPNGFNVPYGHYNNPEIINKEHLDEIHELIQDVIFECRDFTMSLGNVEQNDYVYLDPPYAPENDTSFVGYTENGFDTDSHKKLFKMIHTLTDANKKIMLSNADVTLVRDNFTADKYNTTSILCKRSINSKKPESTTKEVIIKNY